MFTSTTRLIALLVILVATVMGVGLLGVVLPEYRARLEAQGERTLREVAALRVDMVDLAIESWMNNLGDHVARPEIHAYAQDLISDIEDPDAYMVDFLADCQIQGESPEYDFLDFDCDLLVSTHPGRKNDYRNRPWAVQMKGGQRSAYYEVDLSTGHETSVLLARPVLPKGGFQGILVARLPFSALTRAVQLEAVPSDLRVELRHGPTLLAHGGGHVEGIKHVEKLERLDVDMHIRLDRSRMEDAIAAMQMRLTAVTLIVASLVVMIGTFLGGRMIARPLRQLTTHARSLAVGRQASAPVVASTRIREVHELTRSMTSMAETISRREAELEATLDHLEERVASRTAELQREAEARLQIAEDLRHARDRAEAASQAKDEFLANMSHEIRTPMNGVLGMANELEESELSAEQREATRIIARSSESLLTIIDDILDFSKIEAGKLDIEILPTSIDDLVSDALQLLRPRAEDAGIELVAHVDREVPTLASVDPTRVRQILLNLAGNAVKFTERGSVTVAVLPSAEPGCLRFEVRDTGIGISDEARRRLFRPFAQADQSTTRLFGGTGLGLSISRRLVELMGGRIDVDSQVGEGSTFWFEIPSPANEGTSLQKARVGERMVILESNPGTRQALAAAATTVGAAPLLIEFADELLDLARAPEGERPTKYVIPISINSEPLLPALLGALGEGGRDEIHIVVHHATAQVTKRDLPVTRHHVAFQFRPLVRGPLLNLLGYGGDQAKGKQGADEDLPLGLRVLVVEDNAVNRTVIERQLSRLGCTVLHAENGEAGLEMIEQHDDLALVLMDCHMPVMDGYEATRTWRERECEGEGERLPIIALTADAMGHSKQRCLDAGMDDFLSKPIKIESLRASLGRWAADGSRTA